MRISASTLTPFTYLSRRRLLRCSRGCGSLLGRPLVQRHELGSESSQLLLRLRGSRGGRLPRLCEGRLVLCRLGLQCSKGD